MKTAQYGARNFFRFLMLWVDWYSSNCGRSSRHNSYGVRPLTARVSL